MSLRLGKPLPEWESAEEQREQLPAISSLADTNVAVVGFDIPFADVFLIVLKVIFSLLLIGAVLGFVAFLIYEGVVK